MPTEIEALSVRIEADTTSFRAALRDLSGEADRFSGAITRAFRQAAVGGRDFESVLKSLALQLADIALDSALRPVESGIAGLIEQLLGGAASTAFARGGVVDGGRVRPFASGGVIAAPAYFPLAGGLGLAGEAGPEAILPLTRGGDGKLGVTAPSSSPVNVTFHVTTPDAASFRKSETQLTAMLARGVSRGRRGL